MAHLKSPLRYPGGKSKAIKQILPQIRHIFPDFDRTDFNFREPFIGGGSVFLAVKQELQDRPAHYWINDLNPDVYHFWHQAQRHPQALIQGIRQLKQDYAGAGRDLFATLLQPAERGDLALAVRFFVLNRITFSGTVEAGGYSQQAFEKRFTHSSIDRLEKLILGSDLLQGVKITNVDYSEVIEAPGEDVFIFLDPPYLSATKSKLYGKKGELHTTFDHQRFADVMKACPHRWLITYDDSPEVRDLFNFAQISEWQLQYGMNNYKQDSANVGQELFIFNR